MYRSITPERLWGRGDASAEREDRTDGSVETGSASSVAQESFWAGVVLHLFGLFKIIAFGKNELFRR